MESREGGRKLLGGSWWVGAGVKELHSSSEGRELVRGKDLQEEAGRKGWNCMEERRGRRKGAGGREGGSCRERGRELEDMEEDLDL